MNGLKATIPIF